MATGAGEGWRFPHSDSSAFLNPSVTTFCDLISSTNCGRSLTVLVTLPKVAIQVRIITQKPTSTKNLTFRDGLKNAEEKHMILADGKFQRYYTFAADSHKAAHVFNERKQKEKSLPQSNKKN